MSPTALATREQRLGASIRLHNAGDLRRWLKRHCGITPKIGNNADEIMISPDNHHNNARRIVGIAMGASGQAHVHDQNNANNAIINPTQS